MKAGALIVSVLSLVALSVSTVLAAPHSITTWRGNSSGALSITFDDGYRSQYTLGIPALNLRGMRGTFFVISSIPSDPLSGGPSWDEWRTVSTMGHEIGSHTVTHPDLTSLSSKDADTELSAAQTTINAQIPDQTCVSFAYPYGSLNASVETLVKKYYLSGRGVVGALNDLSTDPYDEAAYDVSTYTVWEMEGLADQATIQRKWLIPCFHSFDPSQWGTWTIDQFTEYLDYLASRKDLWIAPYGEVFKYMKERGSATVTLTSQTSTTITLNLTDSLDNTVYNSPLTVRSEIPVNWPTVVVRQGTRTAIVTPVVEGNAWVAYYDAVPDGGAITLTSGVSILPPAVADDAYATNVNTAMTVAAPSVLANDSDPQGAMLVAQLVSGPSHGALTLNSNRSFTYTPASTFTGSDSFTYRASNGALTSDVATVTITVLPVAPIAANDSYGTVRDTSLSVAVPGVLRNDSDPEGGTLTAQQGSGPLHGTLTFNANGSFVYAPTSGYTGTDSFTYRASNGTLTSSEATVTINVNASLALSSLAVDPPVVTGGMQSVGTVTLDGPAPSGGVAVSLTKNSAAITVPATVTVPAASTTTTFKISSVSVTSDTTASVSCTYSGVTKSATLTVIPAALSTLALNPTTLTGGGKVQGTVTLDGAAPAGGTVVSLSDDSPSASLPASVTIPAGGTSATFTVSTAPVSATTAVAVTATHGVEQKFAMLTLTPPAAALSAVTVNPSSVIGGNSAVGTVTLTAPAPAGGVTVALSDNSAVTSVPASVTVPAGSSSATFTIGTTPVSSTTTVTVTGTYSGGSKSAILTVTPAVVSTVSGSISPAPSGAGATVTLTQGTSTVATVTAGSNGTFTFTSVPNGSYTVTPSRSGFTFTPSSASVTVSGANVTGVNFTAVGLSIDASTYTDLSAEVSSISAPPLTTRAGNELILAFVSAAATGATPNNAVTGVTGGGLTWTLVQRSNAQLGTAEIWRAFASAPLAGATVTATLSQKVSASITVISFAGVNVTSPVGAVAGRSAASGAPTASLTTQAANSWVFGVGTDWDHAKSRTAGTNQTILRQYLADTDYTTWVQRQNAAVQPVGTVVTISDTVPTTDRWNLSIAEIRQR